jgi:hypothetical protein
MRHFALFALHQLQVWGKWFGGVVIHLWFVLLSLCLAKVVGSFI